MPFPRNRGSFAVSRRSKRQVEWQLTFGQTAVANVPASSKIILIVFPSTTIETIAPATVVRIRALVGIQSDQISATENYAGVLGFAFVNDVAGALGVTGLPGPSTDAGFGWFVWQAMQGSFTFLDATGIVGNGRQTYEIDSKAMRKFGSDEALVMMVENTNAVGFDIQIEGRILVKSG